MAGADDPGARVPLRASFTPSESSQEKPISLDGLVIQPESVITEQLRKLRNTLAYTGAGGPIRSVLITSCLPGEGKTTLAINLSAVMARGLKSPVVLIDADLRRKSLTSSLGLRDRCGLADLLSGKAGVEEALVRTEIPGLHVLPAGTHSADPAELMVPAKTKDLLEQLARRHQDLFVVLDSTPLVSTSESGMLAALVDGVLLVVRAEKTRRDIVAREFRSIDSRKLLGVVLNGAEFEGSQYYRKYYDY
ncbi:MAG: CpsD/CapB family tyrosine-protein kinase [bacterium]